MIGRRAARFCVRLALVACVFAIGFGAAIEHASANHAAVCSELVLSASGDGHGPDQSGKSAAFDHGCHTCAAMNAARPAAQRLPAVAAAADPWSSQPAMTGGDPFAELRPPRA